MSEPEQPSNIIKFKSPRLPLTVKRQTHQCEHKSCELDEVLRRVTCAYCGEVLDPFQFLLDCAYEIRSIDHRLEEWNSYRQSMASWEYDQRFREDKGKIRVQPESDPERSIWAEFQKFFGRPPLAIFKHRGAAGGWYGQEHPNGGVSLEYVRDQMARKAWRSKQA